MNVLRRAVDAKRSFSRVLAFSAALCSIAPGATAQSAAGPNRVLVMPFERVSGEARIYWLSEAASVLLADDLRALGVDAIPREERLLAFERLQVPPVASLSQATIIRIGQLLGATQVVVGSLRLDGAALAVKTRIIRLDVGRFDAEFEEHGPLEQLFSVFDRIARRLVPGTPASALDRVHPPLPAFEQFVKGLVAETPPTQAMFLETALKIAPDYDEARLALWSLNEDQGEHGKSLAAALAVAPSSRLYSQAQFYAAISQMQLKRFDDAFATLKKLLDQSPTAAVLNNLGVVQIRRGATPQTGLPTYYFNKAAEAERNDPDYYFNLGYAYWIDHDPQAAIYWLREVVRRNPADGDAHFVLAAALQSSGNSTEAAREKELAVRLSSRYAEWDRRSPSGADAVPRGLERVKTELEPARMQRVENALVASEQREQRELATFHLERARRLYEQENDREAIVELRRALYLAPYDPEAQLLLGRIYLRTGRVREAIEVLKISLWSEETAAAQIALAEALIQNHDEAAARAAAERASVLDPTSADATRLLEKLRSGGR